LPHVAHHLISILSASPVIRKYPDFVQLLGSSTHQPSESRNLGTLAGDLMMRIYVIELRNSHRKLTFDYDCICSSSVAVNFIFCRLGFVWIEIKFAAFFGIFCFA